jgi:hypothetical protein
MYDNRGIYHQGWIACTRHRIPCEAMAKAPPLDDDAWELYDTTSNWTQASHDLAAQDPDKLHELQRLFLREASKYNVFPIDDRLAERFNPELAGRPEPVRGNRQILYPRDGRLAARAVLNLKNKSHTITT